MPTSIKAIKTPVYALIETNSISAFLSELPEKYLQRYLPKLNTQNPEPGNLSDVSYFLENLPENKKDKFIRLMIPQLMNPRFARNMKEIKAILEILPSNRLRKEYIDKIDSLKAKKAIELSERDTMTLQALRVQFNDKTIGIIDELKTETDKFRTKIRNEIISVICSSTSLKNIFADALGLKGKSVTKKQLLTQTPDLDRFILSYVPAHSSDKRFDKIREPAMQFHWAQELKQAMQHSTPKKCIDATRAIFENSSAKPYLKNDKRRGFWSMIFKKLGLNKGQSFTRLFDKKIKAIETEIKKPDSPRPMK